MRCCGVLIFPIKINQESLLGTIFYQMLPEIFSPVIRVSYLAGTQSPLSCLLGIQLFFDACPEHVHTTLIILVHHP